MQSYHLTDEFTDIAAEQALLASLIAVSRVVLGSARSPHSRSLYPRSDTWQALTLALETGQPLTVPADWLPAPDPHATAQRLVDLHQRRLLAAAQERLAQALFDETTPATDIVTLLEEESSARAGGAAQTATQAACSGPVRCCPRSWRMPKPAACSGRRPAAPCWGCRPGSASSITCWAASTKDCTCWRVPLAWAKPPWRCSSRRQRPRTSRWWSSPSSMPRRISR